MALWDKLRGEFIDIVEWLDSSRDRMVHRFERHGNEIKYGAKLVVREGQVAAFVNEGKLADVFQPGTYTLETKNLPILSTLLGWKYGFESPFKAEVYFVSSRQFADLKWGTKNPIMMRDAEFGPVRLRAFGTYAIRVGDAAKFLREVVGTNHRFDVEDVGDQLRNTIVSRLTDVLGESKIPVLDLAANYDELGDFVRKRIAPEFEAFGVELTQFLVENVSLPEAVEKALDKRTSMGVIGNLQAYTAYQIAESLPGAASAPGGAAGEGMGLGMGFAMANHLAGQIGGAMAGAGGVGGAAQGTSPSFPGAAQPPPLPGAPVAFFAAIGGAQAGPFDLDGLRGKVGAGELTRDTLVWKQGMAEWTAAGAVGELAALFAHLPPPLPK